MFWRLLLMLLPMFALIKVQAQVLTACPENIGFESGTFANWECYKGLISFSGDQSASSRVRPKITMSLTSPIPGQHSIIKGSGLKDPYGNFSLDAPNGSSYIVKLGNDLTGRGVDRIAYTIKVPSDVESFTITFNYAVVFQNPDHNYEDQPRFTVRVFDVLSETSTDCGSFEFVASGGLPGFSASPKNATVLYKPWAPVSVNLSSYLGKTIRLEFTASDCSHGGHFGYAYIDFNEDCSIPIRGNITCSTSESISLKAPPGFSSYRWFNVDKNINLGIGETLDLSPIPAIGSKIGIEMVPFPGLGCTQTLYTIIQDIGLKINDPLPRCNSVDLTEFSLKEGNSADLTYTYWMDNEAKTPLLNPNQVTKSGIYYVKATSSSNCEIIVPTKVSIIEIPDLHLNLKLKANHPETVDLTSLRLPISDLSYSFWMDAAATIPLKNPERITQTGNYFLKVSTKDECFKVLSLSVEIVVTDMTAPTVFTPNGDHINDVFTIFINDKIKVDEFRIFNRWGEVVYLTRDITNYWNGFRENTEVPTGVYYWVLKGMKNSIPYRKAGNVMLIR